MSTPTRPTVFAQRSPDRCRGIVSKRIDSTRPVPRLDHRVKGSREVDIPLAPELAAAIDAMAKVHLTFIVSDWVRPYSVDRIGTLVCRARSLPACRSTAACMA
jgi:hypothetical protein